MGSSPGSIFPCQKREHILQLAGALQVCVVWGEGGEMSAGDCTNELEVAMLKRFTVPVEGTTGH